MNGLEERIFGIQSKEQFEQIALEVFHFQYKNNPVYSGFVNRLVRDVTTINKLSQIPFLPIQFFKTHRVYCDGKNEEIIFSSSGTTGTNTSKHYVANKRLYHTSFRKCFELFYGIREDFCVLALLPSYLEREGSSLIYMVDDLIRTSNYNESGYYLKADEHLLATLRSLEQRKIKTILIGVSYALLDFSESYQINLQHTVVMETGGMKGKRKELVREELHQLLSNAFGVKAIHSEYGMTELLSQAYSKGNGKFLCPPWMRVEAREIDDPLSPALTQKTGGLNVIDLANLNSCSFIATQDLVKVYPDETFEVLGRFDNSEIRGCNLLL